jgi:hypothetical protein
MPSSSSKYKHCNGTGNAAAAEELDEWEVVDGSQTEVEQDWVTGPPEENNAAKKKKDEEGPKPVRPRFFLELMEIFWVLTVRTYFPPSYTSS